MPRLAKGSDRIKHGGGEGGSGISNVSSPYLIARIYLNLGQLYTAASVVCGHEQIREGQGQLHARHAVVEFRSALAAGVLEHPEWHPGCGLAGDCLVHLAHEAQAKRRCMVIENPVQGGTRLEGPTTSAQCAYVPLAADDQKGNETYHQHGDHDEDDHDRAAHTYSLRGA